MLSCLVFAWIKLKPSPKMLIGNKRALQQMLVKEDDADLCSVSSFKRHSERLMSEDL